MKKSLRGVLLIPLLLLVSGVAVAQSESSVSRLYLVNPDPSDIKGSIDALEAAIKTRDFYPSKQVNLMPSELPDRAGEPESRTLSFGPVSMNVVGCGNSVYAQIGTSNATNGGIIGSSSEQIFGCMYLSKHGIRMSIIIQQNSSSSTGLMGSLMSGIKNTIQGDDAEHAKKIFDSMLKEVKAKIPGVLVELQEFPGDVTRPDDEKIKAAGFNVQPATVPVVAAVKVAEAAPMQKEVENVKSVPVAPANMEQKIEMLKSLAELKKTGVLTDQEFQDQKQKILSN